MKVKDTYGGKHPERTQANEIVDSRTSPDSGRTESLAETRKQKLSLYNLLADVISSSLGFGQPEKEASPEAIHSPKPVNEPNKKANEKHRLANAINKSERMETQARLIRQAIRDARERSSNDQDQEDTFFHPYPEGLSSSGHVGEEGVWLNLGPDPSSWGKELPRIKDLWHEVLALDLTKEIVISERPFAQRLGDTEGMSAEEQQEAFGDLVDDYDLEDHERLEQLGDSIVNMSSRLLAYQTFPDMNEGTLTRISNYPTQNNFLALLFQECGLATRRDALRAEIRGQYASSGSPVKAPEKEEQDKAVSRKKTLADIKLTQKSLSVKRDADMFEAYVAAIFLTNGSDFQVVHQWLCHLFWPFQDQAYRFIVQRSETIAFLHASRQDQAGSAPKPSPPGSTWAPALSIPGFISTCSDPAAALAEMTQLYPNFTYSYSNHRGKLNANGVHSSTGDSFVTDDFLTVAARARRNRDERAREEVRIRNEQELMKLGWFQKGFLNLRKGFRQYVMGKDIIQEEEEKLRQRAEEEKARAKQDMRRSSTKYRNHSVKQKKAKD